MGVCGLICDSFVVLDVKLPESNLLTPASSVVSTESTAQQMLYIYTMTLPPLLETPCCLVYGWKL